MANYFQLTKGIYITNDSPVDGARYIAADITARDQIVTDNRAYEGLQVYIQSGDTANVGLWILVYLGIDSVTSVWERVGAGTGSTYTNLNNTPYGVGGIDAGSSFSGKTMTQMWDNLLYPTIMPTYNNRSVVLNGVNTASVEVGTLFSFNLTYGFDRGTIHSKDGSSDIDLVGAETSHNFSGPGLTNSTVSYNATLGQMNWSIDVNYDQGTGQYYDSTGTPATNLDSNRVASSVSTSRYKSGYYRYFYLTESSLSTDSTEIRAITTQPGRPDDTESYYSSNNSLQTHGSGEFTFRYDIKPGKKWTGLYFQGGQKTLTLTDIGTHSTIDLEAAISVNVNDANNNSILYTLYRYDLGGLPEGGGFANWQTFEVKIII